MTTAWLSRSPSTVHGMHRLGRAVYFVFVHVAVLCTKRVVINKPMPKARTSASAFLPSHQSQPRSASGLGFPGISLSVAATVGGESHRDRSSLELYKTTPFNQAKENERDREGEFIIIEPSFSPENPYPLDGDSTSSRRRRRRRSFLRMFSSSPDTFRIHIHICRERNSQLTGSFQCDRVARV